MWVGVCVLTWECVCVFQSQVICHFVHVSRLNLIRLGFWLDLNLKHDAQVACDRVISFPQIGKMCCWNFYLPSFSLIARPHESDAHLRLRSQVARKNTVAKHLQGKQMHRCEFCAHWCADVAIEKCANHATWMQAEELSVLHGVVVLVRLILVKGLAACNLINQLQWRHSMAELQCGKRRRQVVKHSQLVLHCTADYGQFKERRSSSSFHCIHVTTPLLFESCASLMALPVCALS